MMPKKPLFRASLLPLVIVSLTAFGEAQPHVATPRGFDDRVISAGRWSVVSVEWDGRPVAPELLAALSVVYAADGAWTVLFRGIPMIEGKSTHDQDRSPKTFDMETLGSEGIKPDRYTGIYTIDGDSRVLCIAPAGKPRPEQFSAPKHSGRLLVTLRRSKEP